MSETLRWRRFAELSGLEVHDLLRLRQDIFVVEQACAFHEIDGLDPGAEHLLAFRDGVLSGCLRLIAHDTFVRIGRIVVGAGARGTGLGHRLMVEALKRCRTGHPNRPILLSAQAHLQSFYAGHGFIAASATYLEDGIPHVDMRRDA